MQPPKKQAPSKGPAKALSIEESVSNVLALKWRELAWKYWHPVFAQGRTTTRAIDVLAGLLFSDSRQKTLTSSILARDEGHRSSWNADYALFSEAVWSEEELFHAAFLASLHLLPTEGPLVLAIDDTCLRKTGIKRTKDSSEKRQYESGLGRWCHDPLLPPWMNPALQWGHLMFHAGLVIPTRENGRATFVTIAFEPVPGASDEQKKAKRNKKRKQQSSSSTNQAGEDIPQAVSKKRRGRPTNAELAARKASGEGICADPLKATDFAVRVIRRVRRWMDEAGLVDRLLLVVGDGSFTNGTVIRGLPERTTFTGRTRPDSSLTFPGKQKANGSYHYGEKVGHLRDVIRNTELPSCAVDLWAGGDLRALKIKTLPHVYRPTSTRGVRLRALMLIPQLYGPRGNRSYSHEAYLLTTDLTTPDEILVQAYLDRWSIEVCHRDLKCHLGVGEAQVSNPKSIRRLHSALAAAWALLQVAALQACGMVRTDSVFGRPPRWREAHREWRTARRLSQGKAAPASRPSAVDILALFRRGFHVAWSKRQVPFRY
jgi:hypothetical protein